jgi:hypothetical protein
MFWKVGCMSMAERRTIASAPERGSRSFLKLNPDIMIACAFAAVGILLAAYAAIAFPEMY